MPRRKVRMAFIVNPTKRKGSYKKRKRGLMKKVQELSTLCGIEACAILYGPNEELPELWPPEPDALNRVLTRFNNLTEAERARRTVNQESFIRKRVDKLKDQLKNLQEQNRDLEVTGFINRCLSGIDCVENFGISDLTDMNSVIKRKLNDINRRMAYLEKYGNPPQSLCVLPDMNMMPPKTKADVNAGETGGGIGSSSVAIVPSEQQPRSDDFGRAYNQYLQFLNCSDGTSTRYGGFYSNYFNSNGAGPSFRGAP